MKDLLWRATRFRELHVGTNLDITSLVKLRFEVLIDWRGGQAAVRELIILASSGNIWNDTILVYLNQRLFTVFE